jgi:hypothetical protein
MNKTLPSFVWLRHASYQKSNRTPMVKLKQKNPIMSSPVITTVIRMMESLSEDVQERIIEHLREYLEDLQDQLKWDNSFKKTQ